MRRLNESKGKWVSLLDSSNFSRYDDAYGIVNDNGEVILLAEKEDVPILLCMLADSSSGTITEAVDLNIDDVYITDIRIEVEKKLSMPGSKLIDYLKSKYRGYDYSYKGSTKFKNDVISISKK